MFQMATIKIPSKITLNSNLEKFNLDDFDIYASECSRKKCLAPESCEVMEVGKHLICLCFNKDNEYVFPCY